MYTKNEEKISVHVFSSTESDKDTQIYLQYV